MPLKALDQTRVNCDFSNTLQMMYYDQEHQGQMYSLGDIEISPKDFVEKQALLEMQRARVVFRINCLPVFL
jgi:hypothetical protein